MGGTILKYLLTELGLTKVFRSVSRLFSGIESKTLGSVAKIPSAREIEQTIINEINRNIRKPFRNRRILPKINQIKQNARQEIFKSEFVYLNSWINMARKKHGSNHWDLRMGDKWYSFPNLGNWLMTRMRMSKYIGKLLWNTLWLHKRKWTTATKRKKALFRRDSDLEKQDYLQLQKYILKTKKVPRGYSKAVQGSAKWGRLTDPFADLLKNTIWK